MAAAVKKILVVDDEPWNLEILAEYLGDEGFESVMAEDGAQAWEILQASPEDFDVILLDRMMPNMGGMEVLSLVKKHPILQSVPVIMQTAAAAKQDVVDGLKAGAYYYLTKPFDRDVLLSIVRAAVDDRQRYKSLQVEIEKTGKALTMMQVGEFHLRTLEEGKTIASTIANACPEPGRVVLGLSELIINAIEHGNLAIGYDEKSELMSSGQWAAEVSRRLDLPENRHKSVKVKFRRLDDAIEVEVHDQGQGFAWEGFYEMDPKRAFDNHGRGIAMAKTLSFDKLEYVAPGNCAIATIRISG